MKYAPLSNTFTIASIIGLIISAFWIFKISASWGFTLSLLFTIFLIASLLSSTYASTTALLAMEKKNTRDKIYGKDILEETTVKKAAPKKKKAKKAKKAAKKAPKKKKKAAKKTVKKKAAKKTAKKAKKAKAKR